MRGGVDDPGGMKSHNSTQENAPQHQAKATDSEEHPCEDSHRQKMVLRQPDMKFVLGQIGDVAFERLNVLAQGIARQDPTRMSPPLAVARRMRIPFLVRVLMVLTMDGDPQQRASFQSRHAANGKKVLKPLGRREGAMGEQPVIANAQAQAPGGPVEEERDEQPRPTEEQERSASGSDSRRTDCSANQWWAAHW